MNENPQKEPEQKKLNPFIIPPISLSVIIILIIVTVSYFKYSEKTVPPQVSTSKQDAGLITSLPSIFIKTYSNPRIGFEFKYPDFDEIERIEDVEENGEKVTYIFFHNFVFVISTKKENQTLEEWFGQNVDYNNILITSGAYEKTKIQGSTAILMTDKSLPNEYLDNMGPISVEAYIEVPSKKYILSYSFNYQVVEGLDLWNYGYDAGGQGYTKFRDEILSTIRFFDSPKEFPPETEGSETFQYGNISLTSIPDPKDPKFALNVILEKNGTKNTLLEGVIKNIYLDQQLIFKKTSRPGVVLIETGMGDAGFYIRTLDFVDLNTEKVFSISHSDEQIIHITDINSATSTIRFNTRGECDQTKTPNGYLLSGNIELAGFTVNDIPEYQFVYPIKQKCGSDFFDPQEVLVVDGVSNDFTKVFFHYELVYQGPEIDGGYFSFDLKTKKIQREEPSNLL